MLKHKNIIKLAAATLALIGQGAVLVAPSVGAVSTGGNVDLYVRVTPSGDLDVWIEAPINGTRTTNPRIPVTIGYSDADKLTVAIRRSGEPESAAKVLTLPSTPEIGTPSNGAIGLDNTFIINLDELYGAGAYGDYIITVTADKTGEGRSKTVSTAFTYAESSDNIPEPTAAISGITNGATITSSPVSITLNYTNADKVKWTLKRVGSDKTLASDTLNLGSATSDNHKLELDIAEFGNGDYILSLVSYRTYLDDDGIEQTLTSDTSTIAFTYKKKTTPDKPDTPDTPELPDDVGDDTENDPCIKDPNADGCKSEPSSPDYPTIGGDDDEPGKNDPVINVPVPEGADSVHVVVKDDDGNVILDVVIPIDPSQVKPDGTIDIKIPLDENNATSGNYNVETTPVDKDGNSIGDTTTTPVDYHNKTQIDGVNPKVNLEVDEDTVAIRFVVYDKDGNIVMDIIRWVLKSGMQSFELPFGEYGLGDGDYTIKAQSWGYDENGKLVPLTSLENAPSAKITYLNANDNPKNPNHGGSDSPSTPDTDGSGSTDNGANAPNTGIFGALEQLSTVDYAAMIIAALAISIFLGFIIVHRNRCAPATRSGAPSRTKASRKVSSKSSSTRKKAAKRKK